MSCYLAFASSRPLCLSFKSLCIAILSPPYFCFTPISCRAFSLPLSPTKEGRSHGSISPIITFEQIKSVVYDFSTCSDHWFSAVGHHLRNPRQYVDLVHLIEGLIVQLLRCVALSLHIQNDIGIFASQHPMLASTPSKFTKMHHP